jgi:hypothetical protein
MDDTIACLNDLESIRCSEDKLEFEKHLMVAFWYSVHMERLALVREILRQNTYLR